MLGDDTLTVKAVARWARSQDAETVRIADGAVARMDDSVRLRDELFATGRPNYGVTTGFGDSAQFHLSSRQS